MILLIRRFNSAVMISIADLPETQVYAVLEICVVHALPCIGVRSFKRCHKAAMKIIAFSVASHFLCVGAVYCNDFPTRWIASDA